MRLLPLLVGSSALVVACAATLPQAELDRCKLGQADGNAAFSVRQGAACGMLAQRLVAEDQPGEAVAYARKACELEDARGCDQYLSLARGEIGIRTDELAAARAAGEKACAGMVLPVDATDPRAELCSRTAELYANVEPRSRSDAGRLYARACRLGDEKSCARARELGVDPSPPPVAAAVPTAAPSASIAPRPPAPVIASPPPSCHEMRSCVTLDVQQRNSTEVVGTIANHCAAGVACTWCPSRADKVDKAACHKTKLAPGESKAGREVGLWYEGYNGIAYDCMDERDDPSCLGM